jgi:1-acyl-sn-glycerol-3-phosphate acyltransferase
MLSFKSTFAASFPELTKLATVSPRVTPTSPVPTAVDRHPPSSDIPSTAPKAVASSVSPWLANWAYPLSHQCFLPTYFRRITVVGQEYLSPAQLGQAGPIILAPTHRSRWDALLVPYAAGKHVTGRHLRYMVTADEMQGAQGWFIRRMGGFPIDTRAPGISSLRHGIELLHQHETLVIFPEGGNLLENRRLGINRLHPGLARLALQAMSSQPNCAIQVIPMTIHYSHPRIGRSDAVIQIGAPIAVSQYRGDQPKRSAHRLTQDLSAALQKLNQP